MPKIKGNIILAPDGTFHIDITETPGGPTCRTTMQPLVDALGGDETFEAKPEYFQGQAPDIQVEAQEQAFL